MEVGVRNGCQTQACLGGIVKVGADMGQIDERHLESFDELNWPLGPR